MNIFKDTDFTWWQLGSLKWAVLFIGVAIGAVWPEIFRPYALWLFCAGILLSIVPAVAWFHSR